MPTPKPHERDALPRQPKPPAVRSSPLAVGERLKFRRLTRLAIRADGQWICAHTTQFSGVAGSQDRLRGRLRLIHVESKRSRWLTNGHNGDGLPQFSADGRRVLFLSRRPLGPDDREPRRALWSIAIDGGEAELLYRHASDIQTFSTGDDGRWIAFVATAERDANASRQRRKTEKSPAYETADWLRANVPGNVAHALHVPTRTAIAVRLGGSRNAMSTAIAGNIITVTASETPLADSGWSGRLMLARLPDDAAVDAHRRARRSRRRPLSAVAITPPNGARTLVANRELVAFGSVGPDGDWLRDGAVGVLRLSDVDDRWLAQRRPPAKGRPPIAWCGRNLQEQLEPVGIVSGSDAVQVIAAGPRGFDRGLARVPIDASDASWIDLPPGIVRPAVVAADGTLAFGFESDRTAPCIATLSPSQLAEGDRKPTPIATIDADQHKLGSLPAEVRTATAPGGVVSESLVCWGPPQLTKKGTPRKKPSPQPLLVVLHGGPMGSFSRKFGCDLDPGALLPLRELVDRQMAVAWINPRGSTGYGSDFRAGAVGQLGEADALDVLAHVGDLVSDPRIDASRVALIGWSYGGFLAASCAATVGRGEEPAVGLLPDGFRFAACVAGAPPTDYVSMIGGSDVHSTIARYFGGSVMKIADRWRLRDAVRLAADIGCPTLILHGTSDARVPLDQGRLLFRLMREARKNVTLHTFSRAGHVPTDRPTLTRLHHAIIDWLAGKLAD